MIKVENIQTYNIARAIYSARNPLNSWAKSDSRINNDLIGPNDLELAQKLYKAGQEHRKFLRQIFVTMDITAPLYWWKQFDTYKIGTVANSCSTMHKVMAKQFEASDFSTDHMTNAGKKHLEKLILYLNLCRARYIETKAKCDWWDVISLLPESYNQRRTITMNYENVFNIIHQRSGHKVTEWEDFIKALKSLPYVKQIGGLED